MIISDEPNSAIWRFGTSVGTAPHLAKMRKASIHTKRLSAKVFKKANA
jgi:hypothetical protein